MIDVQKAAEIAADYLVKLYPSASKALLEEVELSDNQKIWHITLSFEASESPTGYAFLNRIRKMKIFKIDAETGVVLSMKIRDIQ